MENFDDYRRAKAYYGGRDKTSTNWQGWGIVGALLVAAVVAWGFAIPGYKTMGKTSQGGSDYSAGSIQTEQPSMPGMLLTERKPDELAVVFLDIGQGDAIFIQTPMKENILIDAGEGSNPDFKFAKKVEAGEKMILPFFARNQINHLDYFIASHPHSDHIGGAYSVLSKIPADEIWIAGKEHPSPCREDLLEIVKQKNYTLQAPTEVGGTLKEGQPLAQLSGGVKAWLLRTAPKDENINNSSLSILLYYGQNSVLLTGDTEKEGEHELIHKWGNQLNVDVLKSGHHGSRTSTGYDFVKFVQPRHVVFMVGDYNTFGHPTEEVVNRVKKAGAKVHRTDKDGTVFMFMDGKNNRVVHRRDLGVKVD